MKKKNQIAMRLFFLIICKKSQELDIKNIKK